MKKLLSIMGLCCTLNVAIAQDSHTDHTFQDAKHNVLGYIRSGAIYDNNNVFLGEFKSEQQQYKVVNAKHNVIGYILNSKEVQDANHHTVGFMNTNKSDFSTTVEDANHAVVGYLKRDGTVEDKNHTVVGYQQKTEPLWAGSYYFLLKF